MRGMILSAGEGIRLRPLTFARPKALVPIMTVPIIVNIIRWLKNSKINELAVNLWYRGDDIKRFLGDGSFFEVSIIYLSEDEPHGTAGAVRLMKDFLCELNDTILVVGCDELIDLDLQAMLAFHKEHNALVTISLAQVEDPRFFGVVECDEDKRITQFIEKPQNWTGGRASVNSGVYLLQPEVLNYIPSEGLYDFGKQLFPELVAKGAPIYGFLSDGYWNDIGHIDNYRKANLAVLQKRIQIQKCNLREISPHIFIHPDSSVNEGAKLLPPCAIGKGAVIESGAQIGPQTIIGDDCIIEKNSIVNCSILWSKVKVLANTQLIDCIITDGCLVQSTNPLQGMTIVGCAGYLS